MFAVEKSWRILPVSHQQQAGLTLDKHMDESKAQSQHPGRSSIPVPAGMDKSTRAFCPYSSVITQFYLLLSAHSHHWIYTDPWCHLECWYYKYDGSQVQWTCSHSQYSFHFIPMCFATCMGAACSWPWHQWDQGWVTSIVGQLGAWPLPCALEADLEIDRAGHDICTSPKKM